MWGHNGQSPHFVLFFLPWQSFGIEQFVTGFTSEFPFIEPVENEIFFQHHLSKLLAVDVHVLFLWYPSPLFENHVTLLHLLAVQVPIATFGSVFEFWIQTCKGAVCSVNTLFCTLRKEYDGEQCNYKQCLYRCQVVHSCSIWCYCFYVVKVAIFFELCKFFVLCFMLVIKYFCENKIWMIWRKFLIERLLSISMGRN